MHPFSENHEDSPFLSSSSLRRESERDMVAMRRTACCIVGNGASTHCDYQGGNPVDTMIMIVIIIVIIIIVIIIAPPPAHKWELNCCRDDDFDDDDDDGMSSSAHSGWSPPSGWRLLTWPTNIDAPLNQVDIAKPLQCHVIQYHIHICYVIYHNKYEYYICIYVYHTWPLLMLSWHIHNVQHHTKSLPLHQRGEAQTGSPIWGSITCSIQSPFLLTWQCQADTLSLSLWMMFTDICTFYLLLNYDPLTHPLQRMESHLWWRWLSDWEDH